MSRHNSVLAIVAAALAALVAPASASAQPYYGIAAEIPKPPGTYYMYPQAVNSSGHVAGYSYDYDPSTGYRYRAFLFDGISTIDLGTLGGTYASVVAVNDSDQIIGSSFTANNSQYGFIYTGGSMTALSLGGGYSYATAINVSGQAVGYADRPTYGQRAFLYSNGVVRDLNDLVASSDWTLQTAIDINNAGQIVGQGYHSTLGWRAFLYTPGAGGGVITAIDGYVTTPRALNNSGQVTGYTREFGSQHAFLFSISAGLTDLGTFGGPYSDASFINDAGQVAGYSYDAQYNTHAFLYTDGTLQDLGRGSVTGLNAGGDVIGYHYGTDFYGPFVYSSGSVRSLSTLLSACRSVYDATAINDSGAILAGDYYYYGNSYVAAPLATPVATTLRVNSTWGVYGSTAYVSARLAAGCGWAPGKTVSFALTGIATGSAVTDVYGSASIPNASLGAIEPGAYPTGVTASFDGDASLKPANGNAALYVDKRSPVLSWTPTGLIEGMALGAAQLNATADTAGNFTYSPAAGATLAAGEQYLYASFTAADQAHYWDASINRVIAVRESVPAIPLTSTDLGTLGGCCVQVADLNDAGQIAANECCIQGTWHATLVTASQVQNLGSLGGSQNYSYATAMNDAGQVIGQSYAANGNYRAFLYSAGTMNDLGSLTGSNGYSYAQDINSSGQVTGYSQVSTGYQRAFLYSNGTMTDLGALCSGYYCNSYGVALNDAGQVAGSSYVSNSYNQHAFRYAAGVMTDLGTLGGTHSSANAINATGDVVGYSNLTGDTSQHAFVYRNGALVDLGTLGGTYSQASAINDAGDITGWSYTAGNQAVHAFLYSNGAMSDLGALGGGYSEGRKINATGQIIGYASSTSGIGVGFLYASGAMHDVNALRDVGSIGYIPQVNAINNAGQIAGVAQINDESHVVLLSPTTFVSSSIDAANASASFGGNATLTATLMAGSSPLAGEPVTFSLNGATVGTALTGANGVATLAAISVGSLNPGTYTDAIGAVFGGAQGYSGSNTTGDLTVKNRAVTVTWSNPADIIYGAGLSGGQLNATAGVAGTFTYTPAVGATLSAGNHTLSVTFTPADTANYDPVTKAVSITVLKATPTINWNNPVSITYGTALSGTQLNATASAAGSFAYSPAAGTSLGAGNGQVLSVTFTPSDGSNYQPAAKAVSINVLKATPAITWSNPADISYGTALGVLQLNASSTVAGTFVYTPGSGAVLNVGQGQSLSVTLTPTDSANYTNAMATARVNVTHSWSNVLQPIDVDNSSIFKLGSTVPVKFRLTAGSAGVTNLAALLYVAKYSNSVIGDALEAVSTSAADSGNMFRYDSASGQYIFNVSTKALSQGAWQIRIDLLDGATHIVLISLKK